MRVTFKSGKGQWIKATSEYERIIAHAATAAIRQTGIAARDAARANIAAAGFGSHWQQSMRSAMHPAHGDALNPFAWVHSTINFSDVFETGKQIIGNPLLWIPLPAVPPWPGDPTRQMSPRKYIQTVGPLVTIRRQGKTPLLGAIVNTGASSRSGGRHLTRAAFQRTASSRTTRVMVPLFVGVPAASIEKRFDTAAAMDKAAQQLPGFYKDNLEIYEGRR